MIMQDPRQIIADLADRPASTRDQLCRLADGSPIVAALEMTSDPAMRSILCDVLGTRHERNAIEMLLSLLADADVGVRSSAADALAKIGDERAGAALAARLDLPEPDLGVRRMLLAALGAVDYRPAIPRLITSLDSPDPSQRGGAAWSLGALEAMEALEPLEVALRAERIAYPRERMREAIEAIKRSREL